jgi:hypothetical protein
MPIPRRSAASSMPSRRRSVGDSRHHSGSSRDGLRLYRAGGRDQRRAGRIPRGPFRREARCGSRAGACGERAMLLEQRHVRLLRCPTARRARKASARHRGGLARCVEQGQARPRLSAHGLGGVRYMSRRIHRLCRVGEDRRGYGDPSGHRPERRGLVVRSVGSGREGRAGKRSSWRRAPA